MTHQDNGSTDVEPMQDQPITTSVPALDGLPDLDGMEQATRTTVERALSGYIGAALWAEADENGLPLDHDHDQDDLSDDARQEMLTDVYGFLSACWGETWDGFSIDLSDIEPEQLGMDLWLTRNRHGAGFWDRGLGDVGAQLTTLAQSWGECWLYVGDDGRIYVG